MSTTINHSKTERALDIECAVIAQNPNELFRLAKLAKEEGDDEQAEALLEMYNQVLETVQEIKAEMWSDEDKEEREAYYAETHNYPSEGK